MNYELLEKNLKQSLQQAPAGIHEKHLENTILLARKEAGLRKRRKRISFMGFLSGQIAFIGWKIWIIQGFFLCILHGMLVRFYEYYVTPQTMVKLLFCLSILVFMSVLPLLYRSVRYQMQEIEAVSRFSCGKLLLSRLLIIGIGMVYVSNMVFINNVVEPVAEVTETAKRIAGGSYGTQMENPYRDEIGQLIDAINNMSSQISKSEKVKSEFISSVSHELRTPLTAINGWGETLLEDDDPQQLQRGVSIILKESRRLTNMVEELLDFSKMQDGRFTLNIEPVDVQAEFEDTIYTYMELFKQDHIELHYEGSDELFPPVPSDPERLKQVFCNVLDNAAKHGGAGRRIDAAVTAGAEAIVITVRDYGPGIPEAELPFVKQKFYKGSSKARGSGIGLAVCDEIIRLHEGTFSIGNAGGGGCLVTITLPAE